MPYLLAEEGLQAALDEMCHRAMKSSSLKINLQLTGQEERIGESNEINLYRIAQEVISNTQKHSGANNLLIRYHVGPDLVSWVSEDDGIGFDTSYLQSARNTGLGLKNIQVRVQLMKGKLNIITKPGKGLKIEITVPRGG
jgi:signal transduction histidine kinase